MAYCNNVSHLFLRRYVVSQETEYQPSRPTITKCVGCIALSLSMVSQRFDPQARHETVFDIGRTFRRTPSGTLCVNNSDDDPRARRAQGARESAFKGLLGFDRFDLVETGALCQPRQVSAKRGMRRLPAGEFELTVIPDHVNEILRGPRCGGGERIEVHEDSAIAVE